MAKQVVAHPRMLPIGPTVSIPCVNERVELVRTAAVTRRLRSGTY
ncbi:hypothetical protein ACH4GM_38770 [Streptomyces coeruleorubidus]